MNDPLVHVLVINWNGIEHLRACFETLLGGTYANARFVLVDNASTDGSVAFVRETFGGDPRVEVIECAENLGWSRGNNVGIERALAAGADYVFLLNNDTATMPRAIEEMVAMAEARPEVGAIAPRMLLYDDSRLINSVGLEMSIIGASWDLGIGRLNGSKWDAPRPVVGACGGAALFRCAALRKTGLLPNDFDMYLDDLDLCLRIWNAGYEVWSCPDAVVRHKFGATMGKGKQARRKYFLNTRNRYYVILRNFPLIWMPVIKAASIIGEARAIGRALLDGESWRVAAHVRAWGHAWMYLPSAFRERVRQWKTGQARCRFWRLVRKDRMFFRGAEFPENGWYAPRKVCGKTVRPMSATARYKHGGGKLRLSCVNPYPKHGDPHIEVWAYGHFLAKLKTGSMAEAVVDAPECEIEFLSRHMYHADDTGEPMDIGGWIGVEEA